MLSLLIGGAVFALCAAIRRYMLQSPRAERDFGAVRLKTLWNTKGAFSLPIPPALVETVSAAALVLIFLMHRRSPLGAGLLLGGGSSNLWERVVHKRVLDYIRFPHLPGPLSRYVYNLADFAIFLGGVLMLFFPKRR